MQSLFHKTHKRRLPNKNAWKLGVGGQIKPIYTITADEQLSSRTHAVWKLGVK